MYTVTATYADRVVVNRNVPSYELAMALRQLHYDNGAERVEFRKAK